MKEDLAKSSPDASNREPHSISSSSADPATNRSLPLGIKNKLFLAFSAMAGLTLVAGVVAWRAFLEVDQSVTHIIADSVPAISLSRRVAEKSAELTAAAPALMASADHRQRAQVQGDLQQRAEELLGLVKALKTDDNAPESIRTLTDIHGEITSSLNELNASVEERLRLENLRAQAVAGLNRAHGQLLEALEPLVDDAVFNMVISSEDITSRSAETITALVDGGVLEMSRLLQIAAEANLVEGLLVEAANVRDSTLIQPIRERFVASAAGIEKSLRDLPESAEKPMLENAVAALLAYGSGAGGIFEARQHELLSGSQKRFPGRQEGVVTALKLAHERLQETLVPVVDDATFNLVMASEEATARSQEAITELVDVGVSTLHHLLTLRGAGNLAAGLLLASASVADPTLLQPLRERFTAAARQIENALASLTNSGNDKLRSAVTDLVMFGAGPGNVFILRDQELRSDATSKALLETSHGLAARLGDEVAQFVTAAESSGEQAARIANQTIQRGKWQLVVIVGISIAGATLIMFVYVARRVVQPLEDMTAAMSTLAEGDISVEIPAQERGDEVGRMAKALKVFRDTAVEVQRSNLREIADARRRLTDAIESISEGFSLYDANDHLVVCNTHYREMLYPGMQDLVKPGSSFEAIIKQAADNGLIRNVTSSEDPWVTRRLAQHQDPTGPHEQERRDGSWIRISERKTEDGGIVAVYTNITDDRRREAQLQAAKDNAERALKDLRLTQESLVHAEKMASLGQLTAGIAHEIKNPLNFVNNFAEVSTELLAELQEGTASALTSFDEEARDDVLDLFATLTGNLAKIKEHGMRADGIVKGMLSHARTGPSTAQPTDLNGLIEETLNLAYHGMRAENREINVTLERDLDPAVDKIEVFPQEITRVLLNLIGNGFYALSERRTERGEASYQPTLKVSTRDLGDQVEVRIRDNGTGIPASVRDKIFNPFFTTKPTGEGTGLGLSLSHETIAQQHHGCLQVQSEAGEFTEFIITLPRSRKQASS